MSECVEWQGYVNTLGYAQTGRNTLVHRVVYVQHHGPIPLGHQIHHTCGNRRCVNVDHLQLLTHADHIRAHHATEACRVCGSTRRSQRYRNGRPSGRRCLDCHARYMRARRSNDQITAP